MLDCGYRRAVSEVAGDQFQIIHVDVQHFRSFLGHIFMRGSMESVFTDAVVLICFIRNRIEICLRPHGLMERSIEYRHHRYAGNQLTAGFDAVEIRWIMKRRQIDTFLQCIHNGIIDNDGIRIFLSGMDDTMPHSVDLVQRLQCTVIRA